MSEQHVNKFAEERYEKGRTAGKKAFAAGRRHDPARLSSLAQSYDPYWRGFGIGLGERFAEEREAEERENLNAARLTQWIEESI
jgi:hypothetical protein